MPQPKTRKPPTTPPQLPSLHLVEENWGERLHRASRMSRQMYGQTYRDVAASISRLHKITDSTLIRLESYKELPSQQRVRVIAFYTLLAYGFEPAEFGLTEENVGLAPELVELARKLLSPRASGNLLCLQEQQRTGVDTCA